MRKVLLSQTPIAPLPRASPPKFPGINLELEQWCHHHVVKVIKASKDKRTYAAICNASPDDLPHYTTGVTTTVNKIEFNNWIDIMQEYKDPYQDLLTHPSMIAPPAANKAAEPVTTVTTNTDDNALGSSLINGQRQSAHAPALRHLTKVNWAINPTWTVATRTALSTLQPTPAMTPTTLLQSTLTCLCLPLAPLSSIRLTPWLEPLRSHRHTASRQVGLKKFGQVGEKATLTELNQLHDY
jgi:hypothetical protein